MKTKFILSLLLCLTSLSVMGQTDNTKGIVNGHEWVDLGLSVKWATCNMGADNPNIYGHYYAWGETNLKVNYELSNCFDCLDEEKGIWGTYKEGGKTRITPSSGHDAARENWGGAWRMPTAAEFDELCEKCKWEWREGWATLNRKPGYYITGPNGNSIFLPAAGWRMRTGTFGTWVSGSYWSSTLHPATSGGGVTLNFDSSRHYTSIERRWRGLSIRPVIDSNSTTSTTATSTPVQATKKANKIVNGHECVDLGLSIKWATCNVGASNPSDIGGYYAWGETKTKSSYDWGNCFDCLDNEGKSWRTYKIGGKTSITPTSGHDTARENWGGTWRMPTAAECAELASCCKWKWATQNGHDGFIVTGPNGNSIFLPNTGWYRNGTIEDKLEGLYWSSTLDPEYSKKACRLRCNIFPGEGYHTRNSGLCVRPVTE